MALKSHTNKFLTVDSNNMLVASEEQIDTNPFDGNQHKTALICYLHEWTDFHYGISIGDPQCPSKGRFDTANCFIAKPPEGKAFIHNNNFYYTTDNSNPILGSYDGVNAKVGENSTHDRPFTHDNAFYLSRDQ